MKKKVIAILVIALSVTSLTAIYFYMKYDALVSEIQKSKLENKSYINFDEVADNEFIESDGNLYISFDMFKKYIARNSYLSNSRSRVYIPISDIEVKTKSPEVDRFISKNLETFNLPVISDSDRKYIRLDLINRVYNLDHLFYEKTNNRYLFTDNSSVNNVIVLKNTKFYSLISNDYISLGKVSKNHLSFSDFVTNFESKADDKYKIINSDGILGYVVKGTLSQANSSLGKYELTSMPEDIVLEKPFQVSWDQVSSYQKNMKLETTENLNGVDVLSPVWYSLNVDGIVINLASLDYVNNAHKNDKFVWALYNNDFDPDWTNSLVTSDDNMNKSIAQLLMYSHIYGFDGINIDFENMYLKNKDDFSNYVSYLASWINKAGMVSSIDVTVPWGSDMWSKVYDREKISNYVDYVMLMAYDEYWASSQKAGSVASKDWTRKGISQSLKLIPKDKLILGMPLYTRIWEKSDSTARMKSSVLSLKNVDKFIRDNNLEVKFDEVSGQNYAEYNKDGNNYKIWLEDKTSILMRLNLRKEYDLPAIGTWSLEFSNSDYFDYIDEFMN